MSWRSKRLAAADAAEQPVNNEKTSEYCKLEFDLIGGTAEGGRPRVQERFNLPVAAA